MTADGADDLDPAAANDAASLVGLLRMLLVRAGSPSYRTIDERTKLLDGTLPHTKIRRVNIGRSTLGEVLKGEKFPRKDFFLTLVEHCGVDLDSDRRWEHAWDRVKLRDDKRSIPISQARHAPGISGPVTLEGAQPVRVNKPEAIWEHLQSEVSASSHDASALEIPNSIDVAFVSCDIVGHSFTSLEVQVRNIAAINNLVSDVIGIAAEITEILWVSGGDGGHVVFTESNWKYYALLLIVRLRSWAAAESLPLRITAHHGPVVRIVGADGRPQFVGDNINLAEWILQIGSSDGVVVSDAFRKAFEKCSPIIDDVAFAEKRTLRHKTSSTHDLWLVSFASDSSSWGLPSARDRMLLGQALKDVRTGGEENGWSVLYAAKRIMQISPDDVDATQAFHGLRSTSLTYLAWEEEEEKSVAKPNPFLDNLEPIILREVVQAGELIERRSNEIICKHGDRGETMFVILRGQVGVYKSEGQGSGNPSKPAFVMSEGEIIGELAFALGHTRTANLVTLTDTALLSFNMTDIMNRLPVGPHGQRTREAVHRFIDYRVLEHISDNTEYLLDNVDNERRGPLTKGRKSWRDALGTLAIGCRLISINPPDLHISLDLVEAVIGQDIRSFSDTGGLFILASGELHSVDPESKLDGARFPILWVNIPGVRTQISKKYTVTEGSIKIFHIAASAIASLESAKRAALYDAIEQASVT